MDAYKHNSFAMVDRHTVMKKLIYITFLLSLSLNAQRKIDLDRPASAGHIAGALLELSRNQQLASTPSASEAYTFGDAADFNNETDAVNAGWTSGSYGDITINSVSDGSGGFMISSSISSATSARLRIAVPLVGGVTYDYIVEGRETGSGASGRIIDPRKTDNTDYAAISSQPLLTATFATYNLTLSPPTSGDYWIQFDFIGEASGHGIDIKSIRITPQ